ncbi:MAG TPA: imidazoleglycerol-phosphate dehydratase HisB [Armatimonadota bacterium]|jgi:imidazoleglycerol-phosphate dehydratase
MERTATIERNTNETQIRLSLAVDGTGLASVETGIGFLDHMLTLFAHHGRFDLDVRAVGDLHVDPHHTVEDVGIALGQAIAEALGDKAGIVRYGNFSVPMDEALVLCSLDLSGRPYLVLDVELTNPRLGEMDTELVQDFFQAVADNARMNLHIRQLSGRNTHHIVEAAFKAVARALDDATQLDPRVQGIPSTKGSV